MPGLYTVCGRRRCSLVNRCPQGARGTLHSVASDQDNSDGKQTRVNAMIDEFRAARQRRLVTGGVTGGVTRAVRPPAPVATEPDPDPAPAPAPEPLPPDEEGH